MEELIYPDILNTRVTAFFTGRDIGADPARISKVAQIQEDNIFIPIQRHTDTVYILGSSPEPAVADAVITEEKGILLGVEVADCVPILIYEKRLGISGIVHAGWRGTSEGILRKTLSIIKERFSGNPENILIAMGPSIRWCCYEVGRDVMRAVERVTGEGEYATKKGETYCLDLASANKYQALRLSVPEENIWISEECTFCYPDRFYSYRYAKGPTGRQGGFIGNIAVAS